MVEKFVAITVTKLVVMVVGDVVRPLGTLPEAVTTTLVAGIPDDEVEFGNMAEEGLGDSESEPLDVGGASVESPELGPERPEDDGDSLLGLDTEVVAEEPFDVPIGVLIEAFANGAKGRLVGSAEPDSDSEITVEGPVAEDGSPLNVRGMDGDGVEVERPRDVLSARDDDNETPVTVTTGIVAPPEEAGPVVFVPICKLLATATNNTSLTCTRTELAAELSELGTALPVSTLLEASEAVGLLESPLEGRGLLPVPSGPEDVGITTETVEVSVNTDKD